jgi:HEPN domain-containing protein
MNQIENAKQLLVMASKDIKAMELMILPESVDDEIFGFHAQQAAEKILKAWLTAIGGTYDYKHDLRILLLSLRELGCDIERFRHLIMLNPFAAQLRYEPMETLDEPLDREAVRTQVHGLFDHVQGVLSVLESKS